MKKLVLSFVIFIILSASSLSGYTQNLVAHNPYFDDFGTSQDAHVTIVNNGPDTIRVVVQRTINSISSGHVTLFCWALCYSSLVSLSPDPVEIPPGDSSTIFKATMNSNSNPGNDQVTYRFFDVNNPSDSVSVTFDYSFAIGINEAPKFSISAAYPNPAEAFTRITFDLNSVKDGKLVLYNLLGNVVKEIRLTDKQGTLFLSTTDLKSGIYFYTLVADGKSVYSRKLIVSHR